LAGLPDVPRSLAVRASTHWALTPAWRVTGSLQQDLQRGQGLHATVGLGWSHRLASGWTLDAGSGVTWANARAMNTFYGVRQDQVLAGRGSWEPGAGLEQWHWGVGASRALSTHWRVATSVGRSTLLGGAAHSPLTRQRSGTTAQVSVAYVGW
jgi:outer membrane protein